MDARLAPDNPLGLNLDFLYGRGYLWAENESVSGWATLERLRMEIPDLKFPFDVSGGLSKFRDTRCMLREFDLRISELGLLEVLRDVWDELDGFSDLDVRFLEGVIVVGTRVRAFGGDTYLTFRLGAMPGEPGSDVVRLFAHDYRVYGQLPFSARQLVYTLLQRVVSADAIAGAGHGTSFSVALRGDSLTFRPLKLVLLHVFARHGWKLPNVSSVVMGDLMCRPGSAMLRARSVDQEWTRDKSTGGGSRHIAAALAADEASSLFEEGDRAIYAGNTAEALTIYQSFQDRYRTHPFLVSRLIDSLLQDPAAVNLAEVAGLCQGLEDRDEQSLTAAMGRARLADISGNADASLAAWTRVSELLEARGEALDRTLCDVVVARHMAQADPAGAAVRLNAALRADPRNRSALEALCDVYERTRQWDELESVLKRLTGIASDKESQVAAYVRLARHLAERQGQVDEARAFLERALRLAPNRFEILDALGEAWVQSGDPARAVKTLGSAATAARQRGDYRTASRLLLRIGQLWHSSLGNREQALMQTRRAMDLWEEGGVNDPVGRAEQLRYAAKLCEEDRQHSEAIAYWTEALAALQLVEARADRRARADVRRALADTHREVAAAYRARGRHDIAANHERRLVEMDPTDIEALEAMEEHYIELGEVEEFLDNLHAAIDRVGPHPESIALRIRLAERLQDLERFSEAATVLEGALGVVPGSERVRRLLAGLLVEAGQGGRLVEVLTELRDRVHQRDVRWAITLDIGDAKLDVLHDTEGAARDYRDATLLLPSRREAYVRCRVALETLADATDWGQGSPLGGTLAEDLLILWQRLASSAPSPEERERVREEARSVARRMGEYAPEHLLESSDAEMLIEPPDLESPMFEDSWSEAQDHSEDFERDSPTRMVEVPSISSEDGDRTSLPWARREPTPSPEIETLEISRVPVIPSPPVRSPEPAPDESVPETPARSISPDLAKFRESYDYALRKPPELPDLDDVSPDSPLAKILRKVPKLGGNSEPEPSRGKDVRPQEAVHNDALDADVDALESTITAARKDQDDETLADALEKLLQTEAVEPERRVELTFELGELLYYELEDGDRALDWLLAVRRLDPTGYGARPGVLNAIEAIYEERGSVDGQVEILTARLEQAQNDDLRDTYRLLLAQVEWESRGDRGAAESWLNTVLERDDRHEGARRLLAEIAEEFGEWVAAAEHLETALTVAGDGLDSLELQKRLANLYLDRLAAPEEALDHLRRVQKAAPSDAAVMDAIRRCQAALGDWDAYTSSLWEELRLLLGLTLPATDDIDPADLIEVTSVPEPLRVPASHVLADIARVEQDERGDLRRAHALWSTVIALWPEHLEAVERQIDLEQKLEDDGAEI